MKKIKNFNAIILISLMALTALPIVASASESNEYRFQLIDRFDANWVEAYKGKPGSGGGGDTIPQEKDWGYSRIGSDAARAATSGTVTVAVLDTGLDPNHSDLSGLIVACFSGSKRQDYDCSDRNVKDDDGHGTHVAGTIAAIDNEADIVGVAAGHVNFINGKVLGKRGGDWSDLSWSIRHAADLGADVISMSLGGDLTGATSLINELQAAIDYAFGLGAVIVVAAGNEGDATCSADDEEPSWPAKSNNVIAVGATGLHDGSNWLTEWTGVENDVFPCFSNSGSYVDIAAPGVYITSLKRGGGVTDMHGTSMAAPHVTAVVALLMANGMLNNQVENRLTSTAIDMGYDPLLQGAGLLNAAAAV